MKEDIVKEKSFAFAATIVATCRQLRKEHKEYLLSDQLMQSGTAIGVHVREARNAGSKESFVGKMRAAQNASDQTLYWLALLREDGQLTTAAWEALEDKATALLKITSSIIITSTKAKEPAAA